MVKNTDPEQTIPKPVHWIASSRRDLQRFPKLVRRTVGKALQNAQIGEKHPRAKPLKGFSGAGVLEVVESNDGNTYRAVYTVKFPGVVYVLHVFQKKSKSGKRTDRADINKIHTRLKEAEVAYARYLQEKASAT